MRQGIIAIAAYMLLAGWAVSAEPWHIVFSDGTNLTTRYTSTNVVGSCPVGGVENMAGNSTTNAGTIHGTNIVAMGTLNVSGAATFGGVITGNGSGITNIAETVRPTLIGGRLDFVESLNSIDGPIFQVLFSDTDAQVWASFHVEHAGSYKVMMVWKPSAANTSKTMSGALLGSTAVAGDVLTTYNLSGGNWDIAIPNAADTIVHSLYGSAHTFAAGTDVVAIYLKDDNAGGAAGYIVVKGLYLVRQ